MSSSGSTVVWCVQCMVQYKRVEMYKHISDIGLFGKSIYRQLTVLLLFITLLGLSVVVWLR